MFTIPSTSSSKRRKLSRRDETECRRCCENEGMTVEGSSGRKGKRRRDRMTLGRGLGSKKEVWLAINQRKLANQVAISSIVRLWLGQSGESEPDNGKFPFPVLKSDRSPRDDLSVFLSTCSMTVSGWWQVRVLIDDRGLYRMIDRGDSFSDKDRCVRSHI